MVVNYQDREYEVVVLKKHNRNSYIRVKEDGKIYLTTSYLMSEKAIRKLIEENYHSICHMIDRMEKKRKANDGFFYLGKHYDLVRTDGELFLGEEKAFFPLGMDLDKWYRKQAKTIFSEHLDEVYRNFNRKIPYPKLCIRKMTTRWGVCNTKEAKVTLNLELIKRDLKYLDYVITHELSHLIHPNHSEAFWKLVEENYKDCKKVRREMKDF